MYIPEWFTGKPWHELNISMCFMQHLIRCCIRRYLWKILSGFMWVSGCMWLSGFKWLKVVKGGEKWEKVVKSGQKWLKVVKNCEKW